MSLQSQGERETIIDSIETLSSGDISSNASRSYPMPSCHLSKSIFMLFRNL